MHVVTLPICQGVAKAETRRLTEDCRKPRAIGSFVGTEIRVARRPVGYFSTPRAARLAGIHPPAHMLQRYEARLHEHPFFVGSSRVAQRAARHAIFARCHAL